MHPYDILEILNICLSSVAILLNFLVVITLLTRKSLSKPCYVLLTSLAFSDLLIAATHLAWKWCEFPVVWSSIIGGRPSNNEWFLVLEGFLSVTNSVARWSSLVAMLSLAVDLLKRVTKPLQYQRLATRGRYKALVIISWILSAVSVAIIRASSLTAFYWFIMVSELIFEVSVFAFVIVYTIIFCKIRHAVNQSPSQNTGLKKSAFTFLLILTTYFICQMPLAWFLGCLLAFQKRMNFDAVFVSLAAIKCIFVSNYIFDPLIYMIRIPEIRRKLLCFGFFRTRHRSVRSKSRSDTGQTRSFSLSKL